MVAALGVHPSQGTSQSFSGAMLLAVSAPGCVLALLAFSGLFTTTEERAKIPSREGAADISSNDPSGIWDTAVHI